MAIVTTHVAAVQELYVAYFGRPADVAGLDYWTNVVQAQGGSTTAVSASFAAQPEYIVSFFGKTNVQIIDQIYANLFGRAASTTDGRAYWVNLLNAGTVGISTIVAQVADGAQTTDAEAVENKVIAATAFTNALDTPAEQAGYNGASALVLAKAFITGVTTDATLTTAITTANLNAQVAAVVKAGTPFTLNAGLAALETAVEARADFLEDNDLVLATASASLTADVTAATGAINTLIPGYTAATTAVKAALLADQVRANNTALTARNTDVTELNAEAAAVTGLSAAIANVRAATTANEEAIEAAEETQIDRNVATSEFNLRSATTVTVNANGTATIPGTGTGPGPFPAVDILVLNARGTLVLATGVTEVKYPGVTALRDTIVADIDADADAALAVTALATAEGELVITDNQDLVDDVLGAYAAQVLAQEKIETLTEAVADRVAALAQQTAYTALNTAVTDANTAFTLNGFVAPVILDDIASVSATSGSDIFVLGTEETVTISAFGRSGTDSLFIGTDYVVNTGDLDSGNNAALEVFFVQNGTRTEVHVEQAPFGSASDDVTIITLVGVDAADLQLVNGIISLKAGA